MMEPEFSFPFEPYEIQKTFMRELYLTIENYKLGIFESPTGTGKSLSICCGALQWQKDSYKKHLESLQKEITELKQKISSIETTDNWLEEKFEELTIKRNLAAVELQLSNHKKRIDSFNQMKQRVNKKEKHDVKKAIDYKNINKSDVEIENKENEDDKEDVDLILEECERDSESEDELEETEENENRDPKIFISSRTHSQLSQFIGEIKRTVFREDTRVVTLASRQHYCINSDVSKLKNVNLINERCLDMQKSNNKSTSVDENGRALKKTKTKSCTSCPYYNHSNITRLKETMLVEMMDIEDLVKCGKTLKACPYYASRMALEDAEVVLVSHAGMVSGGARSGVSLKLQNNILILDEAHGLTAALENAHSAPVSAKQLASVKTFLKFYIDKYRGKLSSRNLLTLNQMSFVVGKLVGMVKSKSTEKQDTTILTLEHFVIKAEIDHMNLRPLVEFSRKTRLAPKLHGFSMRYSQQALEEESKSAAAKKSSFKDFLSNIAKKTEVVEKVKTEDKPVVQVPTETSAGSGLYAILDFLDRLCDRSENGRVLVQRGEENGLLKYLLLNPAEHFSDVVKQCRSVILAGGTMEPISEFEGLLKCDCEKEVNVVKCGHVVPPENVLGVCLSKGPSNVNLNFSYENRMSKELVRSDSSSESSQSEYESDFLMTKEYLDPDFEHIVENESNSLMTEEYLDPDFNYADRTYLLKEVSGILRNVCSIVPGGIVCFLPSYSYEKTIYEHLNANKVIETICKKKSVFREPKSSAEVDQVLSKFAAAVRSKEGNRNGALLLSVVGGKLSEGLNFSDDLGRCIIVVGMPYPNVKSPELQEKMNYLNRTASGAGNAYYENLCMKAVNQCIGRAVRHAKDYACVLLVDERYSRPLTMAALPSFVQKSLMSNCSFGPTIGSMAKFFARHKKP